jgi:hypothetical protein
LFQVLQKEQKVRLLTITLAALVLILGAVAQSEQPPGEKAGPPQNRRFVDLDGDGLNDNVRDLDHDGLPDFRKETAPEPPLMTLRGTTNIFKAIEPSNSDSDMSLFLSNSERFGYLKFCTRALSQNRGGFAAGEDFGPGSGIGQSTSSGGCAGGVCR